MQRQCCRCLGAVDECQTFFRTKLEGCDARLEQQPCGGQPLAIGMNSPRLADGKVDFGGKGVWAPIWVQDWADTRYVDKAIDVPFTPAGLALFKERRANLSKDDPEGYCLPAGVPRISPFPYKLIQTPTELVFLDEGNIHSYREIYMDGRGHPKDPDSLWMGHSIGKWEGDTLVIDSVGFNDKTWLTGQGVPHSDALHVIEKLTRPSLGTLQIEVTIDDPKAFTALYTYQRTHTLMPGADLLEYVCNEFNVDKDHLVGK